MKQVNKRNINAFYASRGGGKKTHHFYVQHVCVCESAFLVLMHVCYRFYSVSVQEFNCVFTKCARYYGFPCMNIPYVLFFVLWFLTIFSVHRIQTVLP